MVPPEWEDEEEAWSEEYEESEFGDSYGGNPLADEEDDDDDYYEDDFVETPTEDDDNELETLLGEGEALVEEGEFQKAIEIFTDAAERFNEDPLAIFHVGQAYLLLFSEMVETDDRWQNNDDLVSYKEEAENAFETALSLDENYYPALNGLGSLYASMGELAEGIDYWEKSLDIFDDQPEILEAVQEAKSKL